MSLEQQAMQRELADILLDPKKPASMLRRQPGTLLKLLEAEYAKAPSSVFGAATGASLNR